MHTFQPHGTFSARLQSVGSVAVSQHCCTVSTPLQLCLHYVSPAAVCQLSCNLSALACSVMQFICCDRPAARHKQLSYEVQAPSQCVISAAICLLSHDLSAWQLSIRSVCQLSCSTAAQLRCVSSAQLSCYPKAQLQLVNSAVRSAATCQLSCTLLAEMTLVISAATCWLSCCLSAHRMLSTRLQSVSSTVFCQLACDMSARQHCLRSAGIYQLTANCPLAVSSFHSVRVKLQVQDTVHSTSLIYHHQLRLTHAAIDAC